MRVALTIDVRFPDAKKRNRNPSKSSCSHFSNSACTDLAFNSMPQFVTSINGSGSLVPERSAEDWGLLLCRQSIERPVAHRSVTVFPVVLEPIAWVLALLESDSQALEPWFPFHFGVLDRPSMVYHHTQQGIPTKDPNRRRGLHGSHHVHASSYHHSCHSCNNRCGRSPRLQREEE